MLFVGTAANAACPAGNCYVSNAETNGYLIGNDTNTGASKTLPFLTYGKAVNAATNGDTIHLNDGSYLTTDGPNGAAYITLTKAVTITPETPLGVTITSTNATYNHYINPSAAGTYTFGAVILDCNNVSAIAVMVNNTAYSPTFAFSGTKFLNPTQRGWYIVEDTPILVSILNSSLVMASTRNDYELIAITALASGDVAIDGLALDVTQGGASAGTMNGIKLVSTSGTGSTVTIKNVTGTVAGNGVLNSKINPGFISITNLPGYEISNNNVAFTGLTGGAGIFAYPGSDNGSIHDNTFTMNWTEGYAVRSTAENARIYRNTFTNANTDQSKVPHGIVVGYDIVGSDTVDSSEVWGNTVSGFCPAYHVVNTGADVKFHHNIAHHNYGNYVLYSKGGVGSKFYNNTVYSPSGYNGNCFAMQSYDPTGENQHSTAVEYKNNICYNSSANPIFLFTDANQTAVFANNLFYATESLITTSWQYAGSNYGSFAAWQAVDATAKWGDPKFVDAANLNFRLQATSAAINAGVVVP